MILKQTKLLTNKHSIQSFSMELDSRGYPHLTWVEQKNGHYDLVYKFWNGFCWESIGTDVLYRTDHEISYSNISIVNSEIIIVFSKKNSSNSTIGLIKINQTVKEIIEYSTNYFVNWLGLISDKTEDKRPYLITHEDSTFKVYAITDENLILKGTKTYDADSFDDIKISNTIDNFIIANRTEDKIDFNFYNYNSDSWANSSFIELTSSTVGELENYDVRGLTNSSEAGFTFISNVAGQKIYYVTSDSLGSESLLGYNPIYTKVSSLTSPAGYSLGGFKDIGLSYNTDITPHIFALGAQNVKFTYSNGWSSTKTDIPIKADSTQYVFDPFNIAVISNQQIYLFDLDNGEIQPETTSLSLLNSKSLITSNWSSGSLTIETTFDVDNYNNEVGDIFRDAVNPVVIAMSREHPIYASSSSSD